MNSRKYPNLKPWQPGESGNPAGRKPGSKNISTIVKELLDQEASASVITRSGVAGQIDGSTTSYAKAIVQVTIHKALKGDMRAIIWLAEQQERNSVHQDALKREPTVVSQIKPRFQSAVD